jgi:hypothetical protein
MPVGRSNIEPRCFINTPIITPVVSTFKNDGSRALYLELAGSPNENLKPLPDADPGGGFASETVARRFQKRNAKRT